MSARARTFIALRTVAAAALVVLASGAIVRATAGLFDPFHAYPGHTSDYGVARTRAIRAALPDIAERPEKGVLVVGSSGIARAFVPSVFDAAFDGGRGRYVSFNLGQLLLQPETALAMSKVIRRTYEERARRIGVVIFGVSVPELGRGSLGGARHFMPDQPFVFSSADVLASRARTDPRGAAADALDRAVFGGVRPDRVGLWVEDWMAAKRPPCESGMKQPPVGEEALSALTAFCIELEGQFPHGVPPWNPNTRGGFDFGLPATRPMLQRLVELQASATPAPPPAARAKAPFVDDIDEGAVRATIDALRELAVVSDHVVVVREVINPEVLATLSDAQTARWRAVAERIAREAGAPLVDFNDGSFAPSDFGDRTHLHPLAAERFTARLAARVQPITGENRASR